MERDLGYQNRIVGHGVKKASEFQAHPNNWRKHPKNQRSAVKGSLESLGWVAEVIENKTTGRLIDGHERVWNALQNGDADVPYIQVELTEAEEAQALLSLDAIAALAETDREQVNALLEQVNTDNADVMKFLADFAKEQGIEYGDQEIENEYSRNIEAPIYKITGEKPSIKDLFDDTRAKELIAEIEAEDLPEDEKEFLKIASRRHTVLNYRNIAEYYAHSDEKTQRLMENSALVIIDFNRAIELGYVKLSENIAKQFEEDYGQ